ncbi:MAG: hypothetical protein ACKOXT_00200 [Actinomycetota bacterium]
MSKQTQQEVQIRKAPKYLTFATTGAVIGTLAAVAFGFGSAELIGLLLVMGLLGGGGIGILIALVADLSLRRQSKRLQATKITE